MLLVAAGIMTSVGLFPQSGKLVGKIVDQANGMVVPCGSVQLSKEGKTAGLTQADLDGKFKLNNIPGGSYTLKVFCTGYDSLLISDVTIHAGRKLTMNLEVSPKSAQIACIIPIPLYIPRKDTVPPVTLPKKQDRLSDLFNN